jgi:hypothetical protein
MYIAQGNVHYQPLYSRMFGDHVFVFFPIKVNPCISLFEQSAHQDAPHNLLLHLVRSGIRHLRQHRHLPPSPGPNYSSLRLHRCVVPGSLQ